MRHYGIITPKLSTLTVSGLESITDTDSCFGCVKFMLFVRTFRPITLTPPQSKDEILQMRHLKIPPTGCRIHRISGDSI